ncbi:MAG: GDP-L-fucose synthase [Pontiella sp.]
MNLNSKIYVAGHRGLVGSGIWRALKRHGYTNLIGKTRAELDLINQQAVDEFFESEKLEYVIVVAAKVGGISANNTCRAQFLYENLMIEANLIHSAYKHEAKKLLFLGSSCIYPKMAPQPMKEECILTGSLEPTNEPYAISKIAGIRMCDAYNRQYGTNFISAMPTNMYGPGDNYHPENSHVLPAFIRRIHLAHALERNDWPELEKVFHHENSQKNSTIQQPNNQQLMDWVGKSGISLTSDLCPPTSEQGVRLVCWGSGSPFREFLYSDDLAEACVFLLENVNYTDMAFEDESGTIHSHINVGSGSEVTIKELAEIVKEVIGYKGEIEWDTSKPDGTPRKLMDSSRLRSLGWKPEIDLSEGIARAYADFKKPES